MSIPESPSLAKKVAVVTGAASGIGEAIARGFAARGAHVVVADLAKERAEAVASSIASQGGEAMGVELDVTLEDRVRSGVDAAVSRYGRIDILVSNAGIQHVSPVDELPFGDWRKVLAVHLDGAFLMTRECLRHMYAQAEGGTIIYMGSVHSLEASPLKAPYVAAKHGLLGLCRTVAKEGARRNVRTHLICPGFVRTPLVEKQIPKLAVELGLPVEEVAAKVMLSQTVDGEFTSMEDIVETALFLAAFPSKALTGQSITVSHGWHMG